MAQSLKGQVTKMVGEGEELNPAEVRKLESLRHLEAMAMPPL
jgi:hypothetical protein